MCFFKQLVSHLFTIFPKISDFQQKMEAKIPKENPFSALPSLKLTYPTPNKALLSRWFSLSAPFGGIPAIVPLHPQWSQGMLLYVTWSNCIDVCIWWIFLRLSGLSWRNSCWKASRKKELHQGTDSLKRTIEYPKWRNKWVERRYIWKPHHFGYLC